MKPYQKSLILPCNLCNIKVNVYVYQSADGFGVIMNRAYVIMKTEKQRSF